MQVTSDEIIFPIRTQSTMMAGLRGGKEDFASASPLPFSSSSLPDPGRYRRSSLAPSAATEGVSSRGNQTFNGALRRSSMNMSFNNPYRKSSLVKASFMGNRSNLNVSFQLADDIAQRKINTIVSKFEQQQQQQPKSYSDTTTTATISTMRSKSAFSSAPIPTSHPHSQRNESKAPITVGGGSEAVDGTHLDNVSEKKDMTTTAIDMDNIEYEVRKTTELIREMTVKLAERDKMQEQAEEQKKAVKQFTDQKRDRYFEAANDNVQLVECLKSKNEKCSKLAHKIEQTTQELEETRYSISRLSVADNDLCALKNTHVRLHNTLNRQRRLMDDVTADSSRQMNKPVHGGADFASQMQLRAERDSNSHLDAVLYKLERENMFLQRQIGQLKSIPKAKRVSNRSSATFGSNTRPRKTSAAASPSATSSRKSSQRASEVSTSSRISSATLRSVPL
ncbi:uncharacterized protein LOC134844132 [Symsagittifera roscoffensis]|uniref:uncharacterized protein LOC134844132 n=1 Tax=Symsagittifera roscoffensis TaxID=84072 RepID=UPI00307C4AD7